MKFLINFDMQLIYLLKACQYAYVTMTQIGSEWFIWKTYIQIRKYYSSFGLNAFFAA